MTGYMQCEPLTTVGAACRRTSKKRPTERPQGSIFGSRTESGLVSVVVVVALAAAGGALLGLDGAGTGRAVMRRAAFLEKKAAGVDSQVGRCNSELAFLDGGAETWAGLGNWPSGPFVFLIEAVQRWHGVYWN